MTLQKRRKRMLLWTGIRALKYRQEQMILLYLQQHALILAKQMLLVLVPSPGRMTKLLVMAMTMVLIAVI
jgi:hypothetical protein